MAPNIATPLKVAIICIYADLPNQGYSTKLYYIAKYLQKLGCEVEFIHSGNGYNFSSDNAPAPQIETDFTITRLQTISYGVASQKMRRILAWLFFEFRVLLHCLFAKRKDIYLMSSPSILSLATGVVLKKLKRSHLVVDVRDIWPLTLTEEAGYQPDNKLIRLMDAIEKKSGKEAGLIMSSIPRLGDYYKQELGIDKPFAFMPICRDEEIATKPDATILSKPVNPDSLTIGYVGSMGASNNLDCFIETIERLQNHKAINFVIYGKGAFFDDYHKRIAHFDNVSFHESVPRSEVNQVYRLFDVGYVSCHDSKIWKYGQSLNKILSYMENRKPIIVAYPEFGHKSMVDEANCGSFIETNSGDSLTDEILRYAEMDFKDIQAMAERGYDWVMAHRSYEAHVTQLHHAMKQMVAGGR